jgi:8-oxo-dGTP diphosphatase
MQVRQQVSAGGVVYRSKGSLLEVCIILVEGGREGQRWQLPKGLVDPGEDAAVTAVREVREETGLEAELEELIEKIEYWYVSGTGERRVRFHKFVHLYLLRYLSGDVEDHDHEVIEARWVSPDEAVRMLAFDNEKQVVRRAVEFIEKRATRKGGYHVRDQGSF